MNTKPIHFSGLNGLRAIAAIAVVISHTTQYLGHFNLNSNIFGALKDGSPRGLDLASYGVSIFFVLSGFLITYLLIQEKKQEKINIKKFYIRRLLRIWPLYYLYLALIVITIFIWNEPFNLKSLLFYIFFAANIPRIFNFDLHFIIYHYWSLGVEEQFYLIWPWVVKKINLLILPISLFIIASIATKFFLHIYYPKSILEMMIHINRFHCMMIGALGSILYNQNNIFFLKLTDNKITQSICWFIIGLLAINKFHIASFIDNEIIAVVSICLIIGQIKTTNRIVNLETNIFDYLGKISYGIYVIHPLIIFLFSKLIYSFGINNILEILLVYIIILGLTILFAHISYNYFEKYFMKLKKKYVVVQSSDSKN